MQLLKPIFSIVVKKRFYIPLLLLFIFFFIWFITPLKPLFIENYSTIILADDDQLLRAYLAEDEQFRFPLTSDKKLPKKYITALLHYEDRTYYKHHGIRVKSILYSLYLNIKKGRRVRGGSTLTMQLARMSTKHKRSYFNKLKEILLALKIDAHKSKEEILHLYAAQAPMGGNIAGVPAASYRYFGKPMENITWAEAALLAVLPNAPGLIHTKRNRPLLLQKRNRLLRSLHQAGKIDALTLSSALDEPIPKVKPLPFHAPHFAQMVKGKATKREIQTTLNMELQKLCEEQVSIYHPSLLSQGITNCAALVCDKRSGAVRAYVGSADFFKKEYAGEVDGIQALRSPGSLIKPVLTAALFDRGPFTPKTKVYDIPTYFGTYTPQNATREFHGLVAIDEALIKSLNVPFIRLLNYYGIEDFYTLLKEMEISTLTKPFYRYGLPLILGAFETSLWDLSGLYLTLGNQGASVKPHFHRENIQDTAHYFSPAAAEMTTEILKSLTRPGDEYYWEEFNRQLPIAWKTGTSYGKKDGWSIGYDDHYLVAVWTGNFSGHGNAAIGGAATAAPLMFTLFNALNSKARKPSGQTIVENEYKDIEICKTSGYLAGRHCPEKEIISVPNSSNRKEKLCPYHKTFHIDPYTGHSVCSRCWDEKEKRSLFIISPPARVLLQKRGFETDSIPQHKSTCINSEEQQQMELIYPQEEISILSPRNSKGYYEKTVFKAIHQRNSATLFWFLNGNYLGESSGPDHTIAVDLQAGEHLLHVEDEEGFKRQIKFSSYRN